MARRRVASPASEIATSWSGQACTHHLTTLHAEVSGLAKLLCLCRAWALKLEHDRLATHAQAECSTGWNTAVRMAAHPAGKFVVLGVGPAGLLILELCKADDGTLTLELVQLSGPVLWHILLTNTAARCCHTQEAAAAMHRMKFDLCGCSNLSCVSAADTAQQEALQKLSEVNGLSFSNNGKFLAAGGDGGWLTVLSWPALEVLQEFR